MEQRHIDAGKKCDSRGCPVALATKEVLGSADVGVVPTCYIRDGELGSGSQRYADVPDAVNDFIYQFDRGEHVAPFTFELPDRGEWRSLTGDE